MSLDVACGIRAGAACTADVPLPVAAAAGAGGVRFRGCRPTGPEGPDLAAAPLPAAAAAAALEPPACACGGARPCRAATLCLCLSSLRVWSSSSMLVAARQGMEIRGAQVSMDVLRLERGRVGTEDQVPTASWPGQAGR